MIGNFNMEAQNILLNAKKEMNELGHPYIGTEHLLLSILKSDSDISNRLNSYNLNYNNFKEELCKIVGTTDKKSEYFLYTPLLRKVIENAIIDSKENNSGVVTTNHLFLALLEEGEGIAIRIMLGMGVVMETGVFSDAYRYGGDTMNGIFGGEYAGYDNCQHAESVHFAFTKRTLKFRFVDHQKVYDLRKKR